MLNTDNTENTSTPPRKKDADTFVIRRLNPLEREGSFDTQRQPFPTSAEEVCEEIMMRYPEKIFCCILTEYLLNSST